MFLLWHPPWIYRDSFICFSSMCVSGPCVTVRRWSSATAGTWAGAPRGHHSPTVAWVKRCRTAWEPSSASCSTSHTTTVSWKQCARTGRKNYNEELASDHCVCVCLCLEWGSTKTGEQEDLIITALNCVLRVPQYLPQEQRFDIRVLVSRSDKNHSIHHTHFTMYRLSWRTSHISGDAHPY